MIVSSHASSIDQPFMVPMGPFSDEHEPAPWLRKTLDESAQPKSCRRFCCDRGPSHTFDEMLERLLRQVFEDH